MPYCKGWCGFCYENVRGRASHRGHGGFRPSRVVEDRTMLKKPTPVDGFPVGTGGDPLFARSVDATSYPNLFSYLTEERWDDGSPRETSTLLLFVEHGILKVCLNDRAVGRTCFLSCASFDAALEALEHGLASDTLPWRAKVQGRPGKRR